MYDECDGLSAADTIGSEVNIFVVNMIGSYLPFRFRLTSFNFVPRSASPSFIEPPLSHSILDLLSYSPLIGNQRSVNPVVARPDLAQSHACMKMVTDICPTSDNSAAYMLSTNFAIYGLRLTESCLSAAAMLAKMTNFDLVLQLPCRRLPRSPKLTRHLSGGQD
jgi:hypothetical protein